MKCDPNLRIHPNIPNEEFGVRNRQRLRFLEVFGTFGCNSGYSGRARAFSLVEVIIGTALILLALTAFVPAYVLYLRGSSENVSAVKARFLLEEGMEAAILMRDESWGNLSSLSSGIPYFFGWNGANWRATTTEILIDGVFRRTVTVDSVYRRNADKDIVSADSPDPKSIDPNTKKITVSVSAVGSRATTTASSYLTNLFE